MYKRIFFLFLLSTTFAFSQMFTPKISVQPMSYDFGNISEGKIVSHVFTITNTGGAELSITNVRASCGCTAAKPEKNTLAPNESTELKVEFNSSHKIGKQRKYVYINSNDPEKKELRIQFEGNVVDKSDSTNMGEVPKIFFPETRHDFGTVQEGKVVDYTFKLLNKGSSILEIEKVNTSCGCTAALLSSKKIEPGKGGTIKVEFDTKNRSGKIERTVAVTSNDPEEPNKILTISADIQKK